MRESNFFALTCLVTALCVLHSLCEGSHIIILQLHTHTMQQTYMDKAVTGGVEAKKLLSSQRQLEYSHMKCVQVASNGPSLVFFYPHAAFCSME